MESKGSEGMKRKELILARHKKFLTQMEVANYIGVEQSRYSKIENGRQPTVIQAKLLIKLLDIKLNIF